jgi:uncharacterized RDD family membrane protein YckC
MSGDESGVERTRAGFVSRAAADLIDAVVVSLGTVVIVLSSSIFRALFVGRAFDVPKLRGAGTVGWVALLFFLYLTFFWSTTGRTPGKQASGLRVVTEGGRRVGLPRAAARALLCVVFPIGLLWVLVSARNRALHDVVLRTAVVYDWHTDAARSRRPALTTADRGTIEG